MQVNTIKGLMLLGAVLISFSSPPRVVAADASEQWYLDHARKLTERLDRLSTARTKVEANRLESQIWTLWHRSGRDDVDALMQQAQLAFRQSQHKLAIDLVDKVMQLSPRYPEVWNLRATIRFYLGDDAGSAADIKRTLALEPRHFGALSGLTSINIRAKNWGAALKTLKTTLEIHPFLHDRTLLVTLRDRARDKTP